MNNFFIGIDGGATKTLARLGGNDMDPIELRAGPSSLSQNREQAIANVAAMCSQLLERKGLEPDRVSVACGVAGAGNPVAAAELTDRLELMGFAGVRVTTDALTSLIGAGGGRPLVMVAVGTGSVAMRMGPDGDIRQFGGWGLAVGDEGSGAAIGKSAVRALLWELDVHGRVVSALGQRVMALVGCQRATILPWLQSAGSREYAALAPAVFDLLPECPAARDIVGETVAQVERLIRTAIGGDDLPLAILGGLAEKLSPLLADDLRARLIPPIGSSLDGACTLAQNIRTTVF